MLLAAAPYRASGLVHWHETDLAGLTDDVHSKYFLEERVGMRARSRLFEMCRLVKMPYVEDYRLKRKPY